MSAGRRDRPSEAAPAPDAGAGREGASALPRATAPDGGTPTHRRVDGAWGLPAWLAGTGEMQRARVGHTLLSLLVYLACILLELCGVALGVCDAARANGLMVAMLAGPLSFYLVARLPLSLRLSNSAVTVPQVLYAVGTIVYAYTVNGAARGLCLMLAAMVPVFSMSALRPATTRWLGVVSLASFGGAMAVLALGYPERFDPQLELVHFVLAAAAIPAVSLACAQVSRLRIDLRAERADLRETLARLEQLATRDPLTGLYNRSHLQERLEAEAARSTREGLGFCLALIDLDHFKRVNDTHGHAIGDRVLIRFARQAAAALREMDLLARWGGEEFIVLLPCTALGAAEGVLARLRTALHEGGGEPGDDGLPLPVVRCSAGLAEWRAGEDVDRTVERADAALYRAKAAGRDRVVVAPAGPPAAPDLA